MAKVKIINEDKEIEVPDNSPIKEYVKNESNMLFGCERGECGTCVCSVVHGSESINRRTQQEEKTFDRLGLPQGSRLCCQIQILKGKIEIEY